MTTADETEHQRVLNRFGRKVRAGEVIFQTGEVATEAYLLQEGRVRLIKRVGATERLLRIVRPGDLFGESGLVGGTRSSTAVALVDGTAVTLEQTTFEHVFSSNPAAGLRVLQQLIRRLRDAEDQIELLMLRDSQLKVVVALLQLAQESLRSQSGGESPTVALSVSPLELSARIGVDVDTVRRNVQQLRTNGYIHIVDERVEIHDLEALRELRSLLDMKDDIVGGSLAGSADPRG